MSKKSKSYPKKCPVCERLFWTSYSKRKYCSSKCQKIAHLKQMHDWRVDHKEDITDEQKVSLKGAWHQRKYNPRKKSNNMKELERIAIEAEAHGFSYGYWVANNGR